MRKNFNGMLRSGIALVLVLCMTLSLCPAAVFAVENEKETLKYASLGDSMTNGYGLEGYNGNTGVEDYGYASYTNQFAAWLEETYGWDVEHAQLAMSAMRAEDLHWVLEVDYEAQETLDLLNAMEEAREDYNTETVWNMYKDQWYDLFGNGDHWTYDELVNDYRFRVAANYITYTGDDDNIDLKHDYDGYIQYSDADALQIVAKYYQESVAEADIVSVGIGSGNFGVFMLGRIFEAINYGGTPDEAMIYRIEEAIAGYPAEFQAAVLTLVNEIYAWVGEQVDIEAAGTVDALLNTLLYSTLSYVLNYCGTIDAIMALNPDAEIIIVGLENTFNGIVFDVYGTELDLGAYVAYVFKAMNILLAAYPTVMQATGNWTDATFYYTCVERVTCFADEFETTIEEGVMRDRFVDSIDDLWDLVKYMASSFGVEAVSLYNEDGTARSDEIAAYKKMTDEERLAYMLTNTNEAVSWELYLSFENAIIEVVESGGTISLEALSSLSDTTTLFANAMASFPEKLAENAGKYASTVVAAGITDEDTVSNLCMLLALSESFQAVLVEDPSLSGLLNLLGRTGIGNGVSGHPSETGQNQLFEAIRDTYKYKYTAQMETLNNLLTGMEKAADLFSWYCDSQEVVLEADGDLTVATVGTAAASYADTVVTGILADLNTLGVNYTVTGSDSIADADLIIVAESHETYVKSMMDALIYALSDGTIPTYDWVALVGEDGAELVASLLEKINATLIEQGLGAETSATAVPINEAVMAAVETYLYSIATYTLTLPATISAIREVNPDAPIVLVGLSNPMDGTVISFGDTEMEVGSYLSYVVRATNVYGAVCAALEDNVIYVPVSDVESTVSGQTLTIDLWFLIAYSKFTIEVTEAGAATAGSQILGSVTVTLPEQEEAPTVLGDINGDGEIDIFDANAVAAYANELRTLTDAQLAAADVNGDGEVDIFDANLIAAYANEVISSFKN